MDKILSFLKGRFSVMDAPYGHGFWRVCRDLYEASKKHNFAIYLNNLNVKSCLKLNGT